MKTIFTLAIFLVLVSFISSSHVDINEYLLTQAKNKICSENSVFKEKCLLSLIESYFSKIKFCSHDSSKCKICPNNFNSLIQKITTIKNDTKTISTMDFKRISTSIALISFKPEIFCSDINKGTYEFYLNQAISVFKSKKTLIRLINHFKNKMINNDQTEQLSECVLQRHLFENEQLSVLTAEEIVLSVLNELVLHQITDFRFAEKCKMINDKFEFYSIMFNALDLQSRKKNLPLQSSVNFISSNEIHDPNYKFKNIKGDNFHQKTNTKSLNKKDNSIPDDSTAFGYNKSKDIIFDHFENVAPIILHQVVTNSNVNISVRSVKRPTNAQKYGWGTLSVFIICLLSLFGVILIPLGKKISYDKFMVFFIAVGVGSLIGDAILHLIPEVLGVEIHDPKDIAKLIGILLTILGMFIFETLFTVCKKGESFEVNSENLHSHIPKFEDINLQQISEFSKYSEVNSEIIHTNSGPKVAFSAAMMIIFGDAIHNLADGLAIGAAFTSSIESGLAMSIAVFCHELPHEFGDFAILLSSGMKWQRVLLFNFLSSLTAFVGLYIGIYISNESPLTQQIIFVVTVGMFLYVALTDMLPSLKEYLNNSKPIVYLLEIAGILVGFTVMALLSFFEESITL